VVGARNEVDELHLGHGPQAHVRRAGRGADDRRFRDRRVDHALLAELLREPFGDLEGTAVCPDVLTKNEDAGVALHLLPQPLSQGAGAAAVVPKSKGNVTRIRTACPLARAGWNTRPRAAATASESKIG